jgi:hypothetical protein
LARGPGVLDESRRPMDIQADAGCLLSICS